MDESPIMVVGGAKKRGRPPLFGVPLSRTLEIQVTEAQADDLKSVAELEGRDKTAVIRDAINEYVADFRERRVFVLPKSYRPE